MRALPPLNKFLLGAKLVNWDVSYLFLKTPHPALSPWRGYVPPSPCRGEGPGMRVLPPLNKFLLGIKSLPDTTRENSIKWDAE